MLEKLGNLFNKEFEPTEFMREQQLEYQRKEEELKYYKERRERKGTDKKEEQNIKEREKELKELKKRIDDVLKDPEKVKKQIEFETKKEIEKSNEISRISSRNLSDLPYEERIKLLTDMYGERAKDIDSKMQLERAKKDFPAEEKHVLSEEERHLARLKNFSKSLEKEIDAKKQREPERVKDKENPDYKEQKRQAMSEEERHIARLKNFSKSLETEKTKSFGDMDIGGR